MRFTFAGDEHHHAISTTSTRGRAVQQKLQGIRVVVPTQRPTEKASDTFATETRIHQEGEEDKRHQGTVSISCHLIESSRIYLLFCFHCISI